MAEIKKENDTNIILDNDNKNKKKKARYFETYINKVLKSLRKDDKDQCDNRGTGITLNAKQQLNSVICMMAKNISETAIQLTMISRKKTVSEKEVANAVIIAFPRALTEMIIKRAEEVLAKFRMEDCKDIRVEGSKEDKKDTKEPSLTQGSRQQKAGIIFPPSIAEKFLRNFGTCKLLLTRSAPVYLATILEYITTHILMHSITHAKENNRIRITIRDLELAVRTDKEIGIVFNTLHMSFLGGGVLPKIHDSLLNKKPKARKKKGLIKKHRFRPGTVSLREIKKFQKTSNCLTFAKLPFERLIRQIVNQYRQGMKISKEVFIVLQYYIEQFIVDFLQDSNMTAIHSGRVKLMPGDIDFICKLRKYEELRPEKYHRNHKNDKDRQDRQDRQEDQKKE